MAYYFSSTNAEIVPGGTSNPYFGVRVWRDLSNEFMQTPAIFREVYSYLTLEEKLPHCAASKRFRALIGAADVIVRNTEPHELYTGKCDVRRYLTALLETESQQYKHLHSLSLGSPQCSEANEVDMELFSRCLLDGFLPSLRAIIIIRLTPPKDSPTSVVYPLMQALDADACPDLEELTCASCELKDIGIKEIAAVFKKKKCTKLRKVNLYNNQGGAQAIIQLARTLRLCPDMRWVDLAQNDTKEMGMKGVIDVLRFIPEVRVFKVGGNEVMAEGGQMLESMVGGGYLSECLELHLESNAADPEYTIAIARGLGSGECPALKVLDLSQNGMGPEGAMHLSRVLCEGCCPSLTALRIGDNGLGPEGMKQVSTMLPHIKHLEELDISSNHAGMDAMALFLQVLIKGACPTLEILR